MDFVGFKETVLTVFPELTAEQWDRFAALDALYRDWNAKINVISRKDIDGLYLHHVLHSLAIAAYLKTEKPDENAVLPIVVKLSGSDSLVSPLHFSNACMHIVFTPSGIMTAVRSRQP